MAGTIKIRLRAGAREIEIEGSKAEIDDLLTRWWGADASGALPEEEHSEDEPQPDAKSARKTAPKRRPKRQSSSTNNEQTGDSHFNPTEIANQIKQDERFHLIERKLINERGDLFNKILFACWYTSSALTSGQVQKILTALHIKTDLPSISKMLKAESSKFLNSGKRERGGKPVTYLLTNRARTDFEKWLTEDES